MTVCVRLWLILCKCKSKVFLAKIGIHPYSIVKIEGKKEHYAGSKRLSMPEPMLQFCHNLW